jgi:hypothetical protein
MHNYYQKYLKYKQKYLNLKYLNNTNNINNTNNLNKINQRGGNNFNKYKKQIYKNKIYNDLIIINKTFKNNISLKKLHNKNNKLSRLTKNNKIISRPAPEKFDEKKIFTMTDIKYNFDKLDTLKDKYLIRYNNLIKNAILQKDLYDTGFYEYQFKLKQYLSECGLNRTTQLYGTCWFNVVINGALFSDNLRGRIIQLILMYKNKIGESSFLKSIKQINDNKFKIININKNKKNIDYDVFMHVISLFYKILCNEGLRNTNPTKYDNFNLTNLAISIKMLGTNKPVNYKNLNEMAYVAIYGLDVLTYIFNKFIDDDHHIIYNRHTENDYVFNNPNHINMLYVIISNNEKYNMICFDTYFNLKIKNIKLEYTDNFIKKNISFNEGINIQNINNVDFLVADYEWLSESTIPDEIKCVCYDKSTLFKLESCTLRIYLTENNEEISHIITGLICNNEYYVYDSQTNLYFECDWRNLNKKNTDKLLNYYCIMSTGFIKRNIKIDETSNIFEQLYDNKTIKNYKIKYHYAIYYNSNLDFTYDINVCSRKRL